MGKRKKRREHSGSGGSSSNSSDTKLVSSVLNETNTVLHGETGMQSSAQLNAPVQHLAMSTPAMNSQSAAVYADVKFSYFVSIFKSG